MNNVPQRITNKLIPIPESGCFVWTGQEERGGYGMVWFNGKKRLVHRVVWEIERGAIETGKSLDHLCRVRCCVNPDHLEPVDIRTNILRGASIAALNAKKDMCANGHRFTPQNTYITKHGSRFCRECGRAACRELYKKKKEAP